MRLVLSILLVSAIGHRIICDGYLQRQGVVDGDDIAALANGDGLARIVGIDRQVLLLVRGDGRGRIRGADVFLRGHIIGNLNRRSLQVMVHGHVGFLQSEMRVVGVCLVHAIVVRARREMRASGDESDRRPLRL